MKNDDFDYSYQYQNWHQDTEESLNHDIESSIRFIKRHNLISNEWGGKEDRILEIGCGMGRFLLALRTLGFSNLTGVDIDKKQIEVAQKNNLEVYLDDAAKFLEEQNASFDYIYMLDILEHIEKEKQLPLLRMCYQKLSKSGVLALQVPNALSPSFTYFRYDDFTHVTSYTEHSISFLLRNAGFEHFVHRPTGQESKNVRQKKKYFAELLFAEFGIKRPILTPNILTIAFKSEELKESWEKATPPLVNDYGVKYESWELKRRLKKIIGKFLPAVLKEMIRKIR
ncbi:MAG: class I SAM-dependent methyltransferase [Spirochaetaceae bacterium]|jgi:2-polyprenyl-3-methyl-5-hydroxy-6-metoxy-1,4-benzoquinol methylase|nr:class I SAM-dependent methyltransferase [Spirochaetaceae bacterium]